MNTHEDLYAKAIDKLEGFFFWTDEEKIKMVIHINKKAGLDINVVYPISINKTMKFLNATPLRYIERFLEILEGEKVKTGLIGK